MQANFSAVFENFGKSKTLVVFSSEKIKFFDFELKNKTIHKPINATTSFQT